MEEHGESGICVCFGCGGVGGVGGVGGEWVGSLGQGLGGWCYVYVCCESRFSVLMTGCARRILAHLRCSQCSILLHLIDICFLTCIWVWQISQIQTCLRVVVGPGLVSTSPAYMRSIASHPASPHGRLAKKNGNRAGGGKGRYNLHRVCQTERPSKTLVYPFFIWHIKKRTQTVLFIIRSID